jgi:biuret amidohydrolase
MTSARTASTRNPPRPRFRPAVCSTSPHKIVGPESNDLALQLRKRGISQVLLAGRAAE